MYVRYVTHVMNGSMDVCMAPWAPWALWLRQIFEKFDLDRDGVLNLKAGPALRGCLPSLDVFSGRFTSKHQDARLLGVHFQAKTW